MIRALPTSGGMNLNRSAIATLPVVSRRECRRQSGQSTRRNCGESWQRASLTCAAMPIAIFDLDGTITHRDTLFPLVLRLLARRGRCNCCGCQAWSGTVRFAFDRDRAALKQSLLRATLRGAPRARNACRLRDLRDRHHRASLLPEALAAIRRHRDAGHYLVLMSASVDFYVPEFGRQLGFDHVISTGVRMDGDRLEGTLTTVNRRGEEKARCLRALVAERKRRRNLRVRQQRSDLPHLRLARHGVLVNGSLAARREAAAIGVAERGMDIDPI